MPLRESHLFAMVAVGALVWLALLFSHTPLIPTNEGRDIDGVWYAAIAQSPGSTLEPPPSSESAAIQARTLEPPQWSGALLTHWAPFCWRLLTPLLVHALPVGAVPGFLIVSFLGQWAVALLLWALLRRLRVPPRLALFGVVLAITSFWGPRFAFYSPCHLETMTMVVSLAVMLAIVMGKPWVTALLFLVGSLQREQIMTLALFQALWLWREGRKPWTAFGLAALIALPGVVVQLALRLLIDPANTFDPLRSMLFYHSQRWNHVVESRGLYLVRFLAGSLHTLGALPILLVLGGPTLWRAMRREWPWMVMALVTWIFVWAGGVDCERRVFYLFPMLLAPLLLHWRGNWISVGAVLLAGHLFLNFGIIDISTPELYGRTAISVFMPHEDLLRHLMTLGAGWAAMLGAGIGLMRLSRQRPDA